MINLNLAQDYYKRANLRLKVLKQFLEEEDFADVIRVSQEIVELVEKALLIKVGINPPKWHDVIDIILENKDKFPENIYKQLYELRRGSKWLRSQREISFYGDVDFIPLNEYTRDDAERAINIAKKFLEIADSFFK